MLIGYIKYTTHKLNTGQDTINSSIDWVLYVQILAIIG